MRPELLMHGQPTAEAQTYQPLLELRHVSRTFDVGETTVVALDDVSLTIGAGEMVAIQGPSGSGKSTLLQIIGLLDRPTEGSVFLDGQDLEALSDAEQTWLRLTTLGFVFQRFHLFNDLTAIENVELPMEAAGVPPMERRERAAELLTAVGLGERMEFRPSRLSGGQRQRVAIARALANNPRIILADEPTGELHSEDKARVLELFHQFHAEGRAIVMVTHDKEVAAVAERQIEIRDGHVSEVFGGPSQPPSDVGRDVEAYRPRRTILLPDGTPAEPPHLPNGASHGAADPTTSAQPSAPPAAPAAQQTTASSRQRHAPARSRRSRMLPRLLMIVGLVALLAVGYLAYQQYVSSTQPAAPTAEPVAVKTVARGELRPDSEATVRTLVGGVVSQLSVNVGAPVVENQEIARVRAPDGSISIVTAPWQGNITNLPVHAGDTVQAGATIASVGDVSRLKIETDDVDEFLVTRFRVGQQVTVTVDAIEGRTLTGRVRSVALASERDAEGDLHYPVVVDLDWTPPDLRAGMTVRVHVPND